MDKKFREIIIKEEATEATLYEVPVRAQFGSGYMNYDTVKKFENYLQQNPKELDLIVQKLIQEGRTSCCESTKREVLLALSCVELLALSCVDKIHCYKILENVPNDPELRGRFSKYQEQQEQKQVLAQIESKSNAPSWMTLMMLIGTNLLNRLVVKDFVELFELTRYENLCNSDNLFKKVLREVLVEYTEYTRVIAEKGVQWQLEEISTTSYKKRLIKLFDVFKAVLEGSEGYESGDYRCNLIYHDLLMLKNRLSAKTNLFEGTIDLAIRTQIMKDFIKFAFNFVCGKKTFNDVDYAEYFGVGYHALGEKYFDEISKNQFCKIVGRYMHQAWAD